MPPGRLAAELERGARERPLLIADDEAHTMPVSLGRALLSVGQRLQRKGLPLMLLLAGTPDLPEHLKAMDASFWERRLELPIGRLGKHASAELIRIPLEERGLPITQQVLERIAGKSHGCPLCLQLWGEMLWAQFGSAGQNLTCADLDSVRAASERRRDIRYLNRHKELEKANRLNIAASVSAAFCDAERRVPDDVKEGL